MDLIRGLAAFVSKLFCPFIYRDKGHCNNHTCNAMSEDSTSEQIKSNLFTLQKGIAQFTTAYHVMHLLFSQGVLAPSGEVTMCVCLCVR